jgi:hypothetical protein
MERQLISAHWSEGKKESDVMDNKDDDKDEESTDAIRCEGVERAFSTEAQLSTLIILNKLSNIPKTKSKPVFLCLM